jgi:hypothetical protein
MVEGLDRAVVRGVEVRRNSDTEVDSGRSVSFLDWPGVSTMSGVDDDAGVDVSTQEKDTDPRRPARLEGKDRTERLVGVTSTWERMSWANRTANGYTHTFWMGISDGLCWGPSRITRRPFA